MNHDPPQPANEAEHDELVAYLDGELQGEDRRRIEQRVGSDAAYRRRLVELEQSWNLLDELPKAEAAEDFTRSTVSMAVVMAEQETKPWWMMPSHWLKAALAAALGFVLLGLPLVAKRRAALRDIPVMNNMDLYLHAESLEFLELLDEEGIFDEVDDDL